MKTSAELWLFVVEKNPKILTKPHFTPESIKKFFEFVYNEGHKTGKLGTSRQSESYDFLRDFFNLRKK